jgi:hypothetical protein
VLRDLVLTKVDGENVWVIVLHALGDDRVSVTSNDGVDRLVATPSAMLDEVTFWLRAGYAPTVTEC